MVAALAADAPEISAAITALARGQRDVSVGVILGSNAFNLATLLGLSAIVAGRHRLSPAGGAPGGHGGPGDRVDQRGGGARSDSARGRPGARGAGRRTVRDRVGSEPRDAAPAPGAATMEALAVGGHPRGRGGTGRGHPPVEGRRDRRRRRDARRRTGGGGERGDGGCGHVAGRPLRHQQHRDGRGRAGGRDEPAQRGGRHLPRVARARRRDAERGAEQQHFERRRRPSPAGRHHRHRRRVRRRTRSR